MKYYYLFIALLSFLVSCTQDRDELQPEVNHSSMATMDKAAASEFLIQTLESYKEDPFEKLVNDVGTSDIYNLISEGNDGSKEGYSVSIEVEWESKAKNNLILTATVSGPDPVSGGVVPELQSEIMIIKRP